MNDLDPLPLKRLISQAVELCTDIGLLDLIYAIISQAATQN